MILYSHNQQDQFPIQKIELVYANSAYFIRVESGACNIPFGDRTRLRNMKRWTMDGCGIVFPSRTAAISDYQGQQQIVAHLLIPFGNPVPICLGTFQQGHCNHNAGVQSPATNSGQHWQPKRISPNGLQPLVIPGLVESSGADFREPEEVGAFITKWKGFDVAVV